MSDAEKSILNAIKSALKPHGNLDLLEWCRKNCYVNNSQKGSNIDFDFTPYFKEPYLETISNPNLKQACVCSPTGSGKTAFLMSLCQTSVALYPKEIMLVAQDEAQTTDFLNVHLKPAMKKNKNILKMWPKKPQDKLTSIHFPTCSIYTGYATSLGTLQSKSIDLILADEVWMYEKEGVIEEIARRMHQRPASRMLCVSQGGLIGDQFHKVYSLGQIRKYAWKCDCGKHNIYKFEDLKFEYEKDSDGTPIWNTVKAELECPHCKKRYADTIENRRKLSAEGSYIVENPEQNYLPNHVSWNFNQLAVYGVSWTQTAIDFLKANNSKLRRTALRQFEQKQMGVFYDESKNVETINLDDLNGGYKMDDFKFDPWDLRLMTVDVQMDRMLVLIRDWSKEGASRLVAYKTAATFSDIERIRLEYNIKSKCVFLDSAYRPEEVKQAGAQYGWLGLNGQRDVLYKVKLKTGKTVERVYNDPTNYVIKTATGNKQFQVINYAGTTVKDILATIQNNPRHRWEIPNDGENYSMYIHQVNSEVREINQQTGKPYYRKVKDQNHAFDCEVMQIVGAMIWNVLMYAEQEIDT